MQTNRAVSVTLREIFRTWWPLAASWLIMTIEIPLLTAIVARRPDPQIQLAAWGVVFPIGLILASPVLMFLPSSTALSRDWDSYLKLRRYMYVLSLSLTGLHLLLAFTPLFTLLTDHVLALPREIVEPVRLGFQLLAPWTLSLAYRRLNYGVLIRFGHTSAITIGSLTRLAVDAVVLCTFYFLLDASGVAIATATFSFGLTGEAIYSKLRVASVLRDELRHQPAIETPLTIGVFLAFYVPLVMTSLLQVLAQPIGAAALARMADPLMSLAVWPAVYGLLLVLMSAGMAFPEVAVVLLERRGALRPLAQFAAILASILVTLLLIINLTPLAGNLFTGALGLPPALIPFARASLWLLSIVPGIIVIESLLNGILLNSRKTRGITEAVVVGLATTSIILTIGVWRGDIVGVHVAAVAITVGALARCMWLVYRTRGYTRLRARRPFRYAL